MFVKEIAVLGAGSWGTALASHLASCGHRVVLWSRSSETASVIVNQRENTRYLPGITLAAGLDCTTDLTSALAGVSDVLVAVPSGSFGDVIDQLITIRGRQCGVMWACKGLDREKGQFLSTVLAAKLGEEANTAVLSGPTFATELASRLPTAIAVASGKPDYSLAVSEWLHTDRFRAYTTNDLNGVQLGGALKNVYAIAAGISDGLHFGANARVALITRGLAELSRLGMKLGARQETLMGLSGMGDLVLTCTDNQSRNRRFGLALAEGLSVDAACKQIGQAVEGIAATRVAVRLAQQHDVDMPIVQQVYEVVEGSKSATAAVEALLSRERRQEAG
ncbi:glycerol-3-phosphate dehydrogenase [Chromatiales bacterium (ex Bugula neritina AB1)]|nr:glycerol-3-phosphate dehydrogenase [Chromatiales bacterium (ex Bugula neritina AB1)]